MRNGKLSQQKGAMGEEYARIFFNSIGARCVEKISTPMINFRGRAIYTKSSSVDFTIAVPTPGKLRPFEACRVEVKVCDDDRLVHSRLKDHQVRWLMDWHYCGFLSFVLWVHKSEILMFRYPNDYFGNRNSIHVETARRISYKV